MAGKTTRRTMGKGMKLNVSDPNMFEEIKRRAYEIYLSRGSSHGNDMNDWLMAEKEVRKELGMRK